MGFQVLTGAMNIWFQMMIGLMPNMNKKNADSSTDKNNRILLFYIKKGEKSARSLYIYNKMLGCNNCSLFLMP